jgi:serine/threonine protein kinase
MGEVYRANDTRLDRTVAIKVLPAHLSSNSALKQRLEREAKAVSKLSHPHICALHDIGHQDGIDFLVMEYLEGETLEQRLLKGPLPPDQTLRYAAQVADGLAKAHKLGDHASRSEAGQHHADQEWRQADGLWPSEGGTSAARGGAH